MKYIKRDIYWWVYSLIAVFYIEATNIVFELFTGKVEDFLYTVTIMTPLLFIFNTTLPSKQRDELYNEDSNGLKKSILIWTYVLCITMIGIRILAYWYCFIDTIMTISVMIALAINSLFLHLLLWGSLKMRKINS